MKKNIIFFILGLICGIGLLLGIAIYRMHRDAGTPLAVSKTFGDVRLIPNNVDQKILPNISKALMIFKNKLCLSTFFFDENNRLYSFSLNNGSKSIVTADWSKQSDKWTRVIYGDFMPGYTYLDSDANGEFDVQWLISKNASEREVFINIDGAWIKTDEYKSEKASVYWQDTKQNYKYMPNKGWQLQK